MSKPRRVALLEMTGRCPAHADPLADRCGVRQTVAVTETVRTTLFNVRPDMAHDALVIMEETFEDPVGQSPVPGAQPQTISEVLRLRRVDSGRYEATVTGLLEPIVGETPLDTLKRGLWALEAHQELPAGRLNRLLVHVGRIIPPRWS